MTSNSVYLSFLPSQLDGVLYCVSLGERINDWEGVLYCVSLAERIDGIYFDFLNKCVTFIGDKEYLVLISIILVGIVGLISLVLFSNASSSTPSGGGTDSGSGEKTRR